MNKDWGTLQYTNDHERSEAARIQTRLIYISWAILLVVLSAELYWGNTLPAIITTIAGFLLCIPYWLTKRGNLQASGLIIVLFILITLTTLATLGKGIHDISAIAYPLVIIFSSLALNRSGVRIGMWLTLLCIAWLVFGEAAGVFSAQPYDRSDWVDFVIVGSILVVTGQVVSILVRSIRKTLEKAREDLRQRKVIEDALIQKTEEIDKYFSASLDLLCIADTRGVFRRLNPQWEHTLGYSLDELEGATFIEFVHPDDKEATLAAISRLETQDPILNFENRYRCKDGTYRWIEWRSMPSGDLIYAAARDITERREMEEQLRFQGTHDILTGIYNRSFFEVELGRLEGGREYPISIIITDIDGLKIVNDTQGHAAGDLLLKQAAAILRKAFRTEDVLARIGGDEFAVLMPGTDVEAVEKKVGFIRAQLVKNNADESNMRVDMSIGAATAEKGDLVGMFTLADQRMYKDKARRAEHKDVSLP